MLVNLLKKTNQKILPENYFFAPEWIVLGVNNICNLHCKMCDVGTKSFETNFAQNLVGTHPLNMPLDLIKKIIDEMAMYYPNAKLGYAFTEPLIYPHLEDSLKYAKSKNIKTSITTNALTLRQKALAIANGKLDELFISLDGPEKIHNEIRGNAKSFQKAIEGIEELLKINPKQSISIFCAITEWNIGFLNELVTFFEKYPIKQIGFMHTNFTPQGVADNHNEIWGNRYHATNSNIEEINIENYNLDVLWEEIQLIKSKNTTFKIGFSPQINSKEQLLDFYHKPEKLFGNACYDVFSNIMIKSDGSVIPAHGRCYNLILGNINESNLHDIWHSTVLKRFRKDLTNSGGLFPGCSRCCSAFT